METDTLILFWIAVLAVAILVYVILDGFDLGVGILFGLTRDEHQRHAMISSIAPYWDGNETWLVVIGASLFAAFPVVYAVLLPAFYIPVLLMLLGLIFRGVAFEFREHAGSRRTVWDRGFFLGSAVVAFVQGAAVGAMIDGIPVTDNAFSGGSFVWLAPFPVLCGIGLLCGYAMLGGGWLLMRGDVSVHEHARLWTRRALYATMAMLGIALFVTLAFRHGALVNLKDRSWAMPFAALAAACLVGVGVSMGKGSRRGPFVFAALAFVCAFVTLGAAFWPYMVPGAITIDEAAAPHASLAFLFWGAGLVALPVIAAYTIAVYWIFRSGRAGYGK